MRIISVDNFTGITRRGEYNWLTGEWTESAHADAEPNIEYSRALQNDPEYWKEGVENDMAHYAHIPNILLEKWAAEGVDINDNQALFDMVNKAEYAYLKTTTKRESGRK